MHVCPRHHATRARKSSIGGGQYCLLCDSNSYGWVIQVAHVCNGLEVRDSIVVCASIFGWTQGRFSKLLHDHQVFACHFSQDVLLQWRPHWGTAWNNAFGDLEKPDRNGHIVSWCLAHARLWSWTTEILWTDTGIGITADHHIINTDRLNRLPTETIYHPLHSLWLLYQISSRSGCKQPRFMACGCGFFGLTYSAGQLSSDPYMSCMLLHGADIIGYTLALSADKYGRNTVQVPCRIKLKMCIVWVMVALTITSTIWRWNILKHDELSVLRCFAHAWLCVEAGSFFLAAGCLLLCSVGTPGGALVLSSAVIGRLCVDVCFTTVYVGLAEIFTGSSQKILSFANQFGHGPWLVLSQDLFARCFVSAPKSMSETAPFESNCLNCSISHILNLFSFAADPLQGLH